MSLGRKVVGRPETAPGIGLRGRLRWLVVPMLAGALCACQAIYQNHGYVPDQKDLDEIKTGLDTRDTVKAFIGPPTTEGLLGDKEWFYVQSRWMTYGAKTPKEIDRQVVAISFDDAGRVSNIERFGLEKGEAIVISRRVTTEPIKGKTFLRQLLGNIGRIDVAQALERPQE